ncbi:SpoIIE family protein phosphatase [Paenibacillus thermotolerans]|uniref:SpoIIE family protein phosphatase n=1 Tax=Paenibacillus thermotolerans TaxID=3027807 RepID=UPI0023684B53|nr:MULTISPECIES: SpoIIE family protein phosphatase [unclassified Paenibacillus]
MLRLGRRGEHGGGAFAADPIQDRSALKVALFAGVVIIFSIILVGTIVYQITKNEAVKKLKEHDLVFIADSVAAKIDGTIARAKETALLLARDPEIVQWIDDGESDPQLTEHVRRKLISLRTEYGYTNSFIVSEVTGHYWGENGDIIGTMSKSEPLDRWFYDALASGNPVALNLDYNEARGNTFFFINALVGPPDQPIGVAGVGFGLSHLADDFERMKYGKDSGIWLIDGSGKIHLTNRVDQYGKDIGISLPSAVRSDILTHLASGEAKDPYVLEYTDSGDRLYDLISYPVQSTDWRLLFQIRRSETISFLDTIKINTVIAALISILAITFLFFFISRYFTDPYKRAILINRELERQVEERTRELFEQQRKLVDSIEYAQKIQESLLPSHDGLAAVLNDYFLLWRPRDTVGGDFYWVKPLPDGYLLAVGDCTGHGVPGALMASITLSILNQISESDSNSDPAAILHSLNSNVKRMLRKDEQSNAADDGLDIGLLRFYRDKPALFAGAKTDLYFRSGSDGGLHVVRGVRKSIGYRRSGENTVFLNHELRLDEGDTLYMTTDGFLDQNGGEKNYPYGKGRFLELVRSCGGSALKDQAKAFESALELYMGEEPQRDDITVLALAVGPKDP